MAFKEHKQVTFIHQSPNSIEDDLFFTLNPYFKQMFKERNHLQRRKDECHIFRTSTFVIARKHRNMHCVLSSNGSMILLHMNSAHLENMHTMNISTNFHKYINLQWKKINSFHIIAVITHFNEQTILCCEWANKTIFIHDKNCGDIKCNPNLEISVLILNDCPMIFSWFRIVLSFYFLKMTEN